MHQGRLFDGRHHGRNGTLGMRHNMPAGSAPALVRQSSQNNVGVGLEVRFEGFRGSVKAMAAKEQRVVGQSHAVLLGPRGGPEGPRTVDEHYALLKHGPTLWQSPDIPASRHRSCPCG